MNTYMHTLFLIIQGSCSQQSIQCSGPMTFGQPFVGTDNGPEYLRQAGLLENLTSIGWRVHDLGDLDFHVNPSEVDLSLEKSNAKNSQIVGKGCEVNNNNLFDVCEIFYKSRS